MQSPPEVSHQQQHQEERRAARKPAPGVAHYIIDKKRLIFNTIDNIQQLLERCELLTPRHWDIISSRLREALHAVHELITLIARTTHVESGISRILSALRKYLDKYFDAKQKVEAALTRRDKVALSLTLPELKVAIEQLLLNLELSFVTREFIPTGHEVEMVFVPETGRLVPVAELSVEGLSTDALRLYTMLLVNYELDMDTVKRLFGPRAESIVQELEDRGLAHRVFDTFTQKEKVKLLIL